jgi:photosynthetic reaction center cytochrome c subunit
MHWMARTPLLVTGALLIVVMHMECVRAQSIPSTSTPQMAEDVYKNIQVMRGIPADQVNPAMDLFRVSLGVKGCTYCHLNDGDQFEVDEKPAKQSARRMMQMTRMLNESAFNGNQEVTCYSCHRGSTETVAMPPLITGTESKPASSGGNNKADRQATVEQVLDKYTGAVGGNSLLQGLSSSVIKGTVTDAAGHKSPVEVLAHIPTRRLSLMHLPKGDSFTLYLGSVGWSRSAVEVEEGVFTRNMRKEDIDAARLEDPFYFAGRFKEVFGDLRMDEAENGGLDANVMIGHGQGTTALLVKLYFDKGSGLLVRLIRYEESPYGRVPLQIDYGDYRDVKGLKVPFQWTVTQPGGRRYQYRADDVQINTPIVDSQFAMPSTAGCAPPRCAPPQQN